VNDFFATPGMSTVTILVLSIEILFLLALWITLLAFRHVQHKQIRLLRTLHDAPLNPARHTILVSVYVLSTLAIGGVSMWIFFFQPHVL
jgi:hypothetical protein